MKLLLTATAVGLISAGIGGVVGYKLAERRLTLHFEERILKETAGMRVFYSQAKQPFDTPEEALAAMVTQEASDSPDGTDSERIAYHKIVQTTYSAENPPEESDGPQVDFVPPPVDAHVQNFFDKPVVITQDEFMNEESGYIQGTLTYYAEDDALCDEADQHIESLDQVIGRDNLRLFGTHSSDPNVVHVRNPRLQLEWEVIRNPGSYSRDVLGHESSRGN